MCQILYFASLNNHLEDTIWIFWLSPTVFEIHTSKVWKTAISFFHLWSKNNNICIVWLSSLFSPRRRFCCIQIYVIKILMLLRVSSPNFTSPHWFTAELCIYLSAKVPEKSWSKIGLWLCLITTSVNEEIYQWDFNQSNLMLLASIWYNFVNLLLLL